MAKGSDDISGEYNDYAINKEVTIGGLTVTMRGNDQISNAVWAYGEFSYSILSDVELEEAEVIHIIESIK